MSAWFDVEALGELSGLLRPRQLEDARNEAVGLLAGAGLAGHRARFDGTIASLDDRLARLQADLRLRAEGISAAEAAVTAIAFRSFGGGGHPGGSDTAISYQGAMEALAEIEDLLRTDGTKLGFFSIGDTEVTKQDLLDIAEIVMSLSPSELRFMLWRMDDDLLAKWLDEADESGVDPAIQRELFGFLAAHAGATHLRNMVERSDATTRFYLLEAIVEHASSAAQVWAFRALVDGIPTDDELPLISARFLADLPPDVRRNALWGLDARGVLDGYVASLLVESSRVNSTYGYSASVSTRVEYDAAALVALVDATVAIEDADLKAAVFVAAVDAIAEPLELASETLDIGGFGNVFTTHRFEAETGEASLLALVGLVVSDPPGVFDSLRLDADFLGTTTSAFFRELLREPGARGSLAGEPLSHTGAVATNQILAALLGPGADPAARRRFFISREPTSGGAYDYVNASRLGFLTGTVSKGLDDLGTSSDDEWTAVGIILGGLKLVDPTKVAAALSFAESSLTSITSEIEDRTVAQLQQDYAAFERALLIELLPRDDGYIYDGDAADEFFNTYDRVGGGVAG